MAPLSKGFTVTLFFRSIENNICSKRLLLVASDEKNALKIAAELTKKTGRSFVLNNLVGWAISIGFTFHYTMHKEGTLLDMLM